MILSNSKICFTQEHFLNPEITTNCVKYDVLQIIHRNLKILYLFILVFYGNIDKSNLWSVCVCAIYMNYLSIHHRYFNTTCQKRFLSSSNNNNLLCAYEHKNLYLTWLNLIILVFTMKHYYGAYVPFMAKILVFGVRH